MKKAKLYRQLTQNKLQCLACQRYCLISPGQVGFCQTRLNKAGQLYSLNYGLLNGIQLDPIEKKPLYHFYPGTPVLSIGSYGCNYRCKQCLNSWCSWGEPATGILKKLKAGKKQLKINLTLPAEIIDLAVRQNIPGIAFTYNEPSIWPEYVFKTAKLAKKKGLYTVFVTNGSWSKEALEYLAPVIDAVNIDIKGFYPQTYRKMGAFFGQILEVTELVVKKYRIFTELTTLIIPTINDSSQEIKDIAHWIKEKLGANIPWHLSRFDPDLAPDKKFKKLAVTPIKTLKKAYQIGKKAGLNYIYVWAPPKNQSEELFSLGNTFCPKCGRLVIKRNAWRPKMIGVKKIKNQGYCSFCGQKLNLEL